MKHLIVSLALLAAVPAFGAAAVTTCTDSSGDLHYTRLDYVYGIPPSPELDLPDWSVIWKVRGEEYSRTDALMNGTVTTVGVPVSYDFVQSTYVLIEFIPGDGHLKPSRRTYSILLNFAAPGPSAQYVICTQLEGPPVP